MDKEAVMGMARSPLVLDSEECGPSDMQGMILHCPTCNFNFTHHGVVEVWDRKEDADTGLWVHVSESGLFSSKEFKGVNRNPSDRRGGIRIRFSCENCPTPFWICIAQHKGETFIYAEVEKLTRWR